MFLFNRDIKKLFDEIHLRYSFFWSTSSKPKFSTRKSENLVNNSELSDLFRLEESVWRTINQTDDNSNRISTSETAKADLGFSTYQLLPMEFNKYFRLYPEQYRFSVYFKLFFRACKDVGIDDFRFSFSKPFFFTPIRDPLNSSVLLNQQQVYDKLHFKIKELGKTKWITNRLKQVDEDAKQEFEVTTKYIDDCFLACPSLYVLRINLGYNNYNCEQWDSITLDIFINHVSSLARAFNEDYKFQKVVGYVIKLDYNSNTNYFAQLVVLFDNRTFQPDEYWAGLIIEYWNSLLGTIEGGNFNWNLTTLSEGLGLIHKEDSDAINQLKHHVIGFMIQSSQYLRVYDHIDKAIFLMGTRPKSRLQEYPGNLMFGVNDKNAQVQIKTILTLYSEIAFHRNSNEVRYDQVASCAIGFPLNIDLLIKIESLIIAIEYDKRYAFQQINQENEPYAFITNPLAVRFLDLGDFNILLNTLRHTIISREGRFSVYVELFYSALKEYCSPDSVPSSFPDHSNEAIQTRNMNVNRLLLIIRSKLQNDEVRSALNSRRRGFNDKYIKACNQFNTLIRKYKELSIFAFNLWPDEQSKYDISTKTLIKLNPNGKFLSSKLQLTDYKAFSVPLSNFFKLGQHHQSLSAMVGYFVKWEYSPQRGRYAHIVLLIDAIKIADDSDHIKVIQDYWFSKITENKGSSESTFVASDRFLFPSPVFHLNYQDSKSCKVFKEAVLGYMIPSLMYFKDERILMPNLSFGSETTTKKVVAKTKTTLTRNRSSQSKPPRVSSLFGNKIPNSVDYENPLNNDTEQTSNTVKQTASSASVIDDD